MSYKALKGFNSIYETDDLNTIQQNVIMFFDWGFLNKGAFSSVYVGNTDIRTVNRSTLHRVSDPNYNDGQVWQAFHKNLVYESGLDWSTQPIQISGVYVNGAFKTPTASGYQHYVDYNNGQVIFDSALAGNPTVKMEYSYKHLNFTPAEAFPITQYLQSNTFSNTNFTSPSGVWSILQQSRAQLPTVAIESAGKAKFRAVELGNLIQWMDSDILLHVYGETPQEVRKYLNFIGFQTDKTIFMVNIDTAAASGVFPLDYRGARNSGGLLYNELVDDFRVNRLYLGDAVVDGPHPLGGIYCGYVRFTCQTYGLL